MESTRKILIVDDDPEIVMLLQIGLERHGYEIISASSGDEGVETAREQKPDLILMDIMMPGINGLEACQIIKNEHELRFVPVIFITARGSMPEKIEGLSLGDDYLIKPFNIHEVIARVRSMIRIKELTEKLEIATRAAAIGAAAVTVNHKINNPLAALKLQIGIIKQKLSPEDFARIEPNLQSITAAAETIQHITQKLSSLSENPDFISYKEYLDGVQMVDVDQAELDSGKR
ncbi:MAG: DNA-binding response regulator [Gemmatimonadetes bacterium]|nr:MAG: DNA-binding response regulator [Gemmatimonadota bacterium]